MTIVDSNIATGTPDGIVTAVMPDGVSEVAAVATQNNTTKYVIYAYLALVMWLIIRKD